MTSEWPRPATAPVSQLLIPRWYGSVPTAFGSPAIERAADLPNFDLVFLGIPWQAPQPDSRVGSASAAYAGTVLTPQNFRVNSIKYGGYLPELEIDVFARLRLGDYGNADIVWDPDTSIANVETRIDEILDAGAIPITVGGNSGLSSYPVLKAIARRGRVGVVNLDAHGDNHEESQVERGDPRRPRWAGTWALRILELPNVDPARYVHVGIRGPRNDAGTIPRFLSRGVPRAQIYTYREVLAARRSGFEAAAEAMARQALDGVERVWIAVDPDVLDMSVSPEYGDEPLGITVEEQLTIVRAVGRAAGRARFGGISFMAIPPEAMTIQWICMYTLLYALAGVLEAEG